MRRGGRAGTSDRPFFNPFRRMRLIYSFTQTLAIFFLSTAFKTSQLALKREKEASELKSENLNSELKFLKSQINPHFLFNALNNIYALSVIKSEKTPDNILKLSDMLRYIIYDCNADKVPLEKELNYINNYIDLQKLKDDQITGIEVDFNNTDPNCQIAPMIFIPFIENAFKHSNIEDREFGWIKLKIENTDEQLIFEISNSLPKDITTKDKVGGVGLENVKRRLQLIYDEKQNLGIEQTEDGFYVVLTIRIGES
jgi:LytS/YehU family sensor histidine kinase